MAGVNRSNFGAKDGTDEVIKVQYLEHDDDKLNMLKMRLERSDDFEVLASNDSEQACKLALTARPGRPRLRAVSPSVTWSFRKAKSRDFAALVGGNIHSWLQAFTVSFPGNWLYPCAGASN